MLFVATMALVTLVSGVFSWWAKDSVNARLISEHLEFLQAAKLEHKPFEWKDNIWHDSQFTIEIDGTRIYYSELYRNPVLIAKLNDPELYRLSRNYRNWLYFSGGSAAIFGFSFLWWLV